MRAVWNRPCNVSEPRDDDRCVLRDEERSHTNPRVMRKIIEITLICILFAASFLPNRRLMSIPDGARVGGFIIMSASAALVILGQTRLVDGVWSVVYACTAMFCGHTALSTLLYPVVQKDNDESSDLTRYLPHRIREQVLWMLYLMSPASPYYILYVCGMEAFESWCG